MVTREKLYETLGELAVAFSNLEYNVLRILDVLAGRDAFLGPILLDDLNIHRVLGYMRSYITARLRENPELCERAETLVNEVDQARVDRNRFIHGRWTTDPAMLASGRVTCFQYKLHFNKQTDLWEYGEHYTYTPNQLATKTAKIVILCDDAMQLGRRSRRTCLRVSDRPHTSLRSQPNSTASSQTATSRSEWLTMYRWPSSSIDFRNPDSHPCSGVYWSARLGFSRIRYGDVHWRSNEARSYALQADKIHSYVVRGACLLGERYRSQFRVGSVHRAWWTSRG